MQKKKTSKFIIGMLVFRKSCSTSNLARIGPVFDKFSGFLIKTERMPASQLAIRKQAFWTEAKPRQVKSTNSSIVYHCKAKQPKHAKQSKSGKEERSEQTK